MKQLSIIALCLLAFAACLVGADTNTTTVSIGGGVQEALKVPWVQGALILVVPIIIAGLKKVWPKVPAVLLPYLAPVLGLGIDYVTTLAGLDIGNPATSAALGAAGVWLREAYDQSRKAIATKDQSKP